MCDAWTHRPRGSKVVSRLANFYEDRFLGFAFLAVPYVPPRPNSTMEFTAQAVGGKPQVHLHKHLMRYLPDKENVWLRAKRSLHVLRPR